MNIYEFEVRAECPNGKIADCYFCEVRSEAFIQCEQITDMVARIAEMKIYQEALADYIRNELQSGVTLKGYHFGIKVTCIRE